MIVSPEFLVFDSIAGEDRATIIFAGQHLPVAALVLDALKRHYDRRIPSDVVVALSPLCAEAETTEWARSILADPDFPDVATYRHRAPLRVASIRGGNRLRFELSMKPVEIPGARTPLDAHRLTADGLAQLFSRNSGLVLPPPKSHFVYPSGKHAPFFLRAGNVFRYEVETLLGALAIVCKLPSVPVRRLVCDTSGILSLLFSAQKIARFQEEAEANSWQVDSFGTYSGLPEFSLSEVDEPFVVISASTSGSLARAVRAQKGLHQRRVTNLFGYGRCRPDEALCHLTHGGIGVPPLPVQETYASGDSCKYCESSSRPITIQGEQFLPSSSKRERILLSRRDVPSWFPGFSRRLVGTGAIRCHHHESRSLGQTRDIYVGLEGVFQKIRTDALLARGESSEARRYGLEVKEFLARYLPASARRIVHLEDRASIAFGRYASEFYSAETGSGKLDLVPASEVHEASADQWGVGTTVVVASVVTSGRGLLGVSQALRDPLGDEGSAAYLIALFKGATVADWRQLRRNLSLSFGRRANERSVHALDIIQLPTGLRSGGSPWKREESFLYDLQQQAERKGDRATLEWISKRRGLIAEARQPVGKNSCGEEVGEGLRPNELFWPSVTGFLNEGASSSLSIREGSLFFGALADRVVTQAEVYFAAAATLHASRNTGASSSIPALLDPGNLVRFNDGVIQAAILRAAAPAECDYRDDQDLSGYMLEIFQRLVEDRMGQEGEGLPEVLLALADGRVRLAADDLRELQEGLQKVQDWPPVIARTIDCILESE